MNGFLPDLDLETLELVPVPFVVLNDELVVVYVNKPAEILLEVDFYTAIGRHCSEILRIFNLRAKEVEIQDVLARNSRATGHNPWWYIRRGGKEMQPVRLSFNSLDSTAPDGPAYIGLAVHDIGPVHDLIRHLQHQNAHDPLTGLVNRAQFERRLQRAETGARNSQESHALLFMDLDGFKMVNDRFGHHAGDQVLKDIAGRFREVVRERDTLARFGGDEFALLLEHCRLETALEIARLLYMSLQARPPCWNGLEVPMSVSIGLSMLDGSADRHEAALVAADMACYAAKNSASGEVIVVVPPGMNADPECRGDWQYHRIERLREAHTMESSPLS